MTNKNTDTIAGDFSSILNMIENKDVVSHNLAVEVIWSAMYYLKQNQKATIEEACEYGINEWIK